MFNDGERNYPPLAMPDPIDGSVCSTALYNGPINPTFEQPYRLMIARFPGNDSEHPASSGWVMKTLLEIERDPALRVIDVVPWRLSTTPITMARNKCVWDAIAKECDYLLMIDSDMEPDCVPGAKGFWSTAMSFMAKRRHREREWFLEMDKSPMEDPEFEDLWWKNFAPATIGAPYCGKSPEQAVCVLRWVERDDGSPNARFTHQTIERHDAAQRTGIGQVSAIGTGLILYDVRTFFYLPTPWFEYEYRDGYHRELISTEDVYQTRNAGLLGMPQYCAWDCWAGHWKPQLVTKPDPITCEVVNEQLRKAISSGISSRKQTLFVHPDDPNRA